MSARFRSTRDVAGAKLERTSLSADISQGPPPGTFPLPYQTRDEGTRTVEIVSLRLWQTCIYRYLTESQQRFCRAKKVRNGRRMPQ